MMIKVPLPKHSTLEVLFIVLEAIDVRLNEDILFCFLGRVLVSWQQ